MRAAGMSSECRRWPAARPRTRGRRFRRRFPPRRRRQGRGPSPNASRRAARGGLFVQRPRAAGPRGSRGRGRRGARSGTRRPRRDRRRTGRVPARSQLAERQSRAEASGRDGSRNRPVHGFSGSSRGGAGGVRRPVRPRNAGSCRAALVAVGAPAPFPGGPIRPETDPGTAGHRDVAVPAPGGQVARRASSADRTARAGLARGVRSLQRMPSIIRRSSPHGSRGAAGREDRRSPAARCVAAHRSPLLSEVGPDPRVRMDSVHRINSRGQLTGPGPGGEDTGMRRPSREGLRLSPRAP